MADETHNSISTKELRLVDDAGNTRAVFGTNADGQVILEVLDTQNHARVKIGVTNDGTALLELNSSASTPGMKLTVEKDGHVYWHGADANGVERFKLEIKGNGSHTELSFHEKNKKPRLLLMTEDKGPAGLFILDQHGKALFSTTP